MPDLVKVRRALLSVSDKTGLVDFARALHQLGVVLISTGGTAKAIVAAGLPVTQIDAVTGFPEMMDGRLKTLHPKVHGGLLAVRGNAEHERSMAEHGIEAIDLLCVNLYPFRQTIAKPGVSPAEAIENIDIGGPAMVRSASKNHDAVVVVTSPGQYACVLDDLRDSGGMTTLRLRRRLAAEAFRHTADYDGAIGAWMSKHAGIDPDSAADPAAFPDHLTIRLVRSQSLRYGENPHQEGAIYRDPKFVGASVVNARQLHGKELSYNNVNDAAAALELALALAATGRGAGGNAAACVIKHANPCGAAMGKDAREAVDRAIAGDPLAAFGGIIASSVPIDEPTAMRLIEKDVFLEVLLAPGFAPAALEALQNRSANIRLLQFDAKAAGGAGISGAEAPLTYRSFPGGMLVQEADVLPPAPASWRHAAGPKPTEQALRVAAAMEVVVRAMASNAIAVGAMDKASVRLIGGGVGQVDRVTACKLAVEKARAQSAALLKSAVAVSDAFFPFADGPKVLIDAGVKMLVHPGGSKRDQETLDLCDKHSVTCMVTGVRRFRH